MSEILDRLLQLRDENSIEYLEDGSENAKEYQQLKIKCEQSLKLKELVIDMENETGRSLVDVQNWLSKEGKLSTEVTNKVLRDLIKESQKTVKEKGSGEKFTMNESENETYETLQEVHEKCHGGDFRSESCEYCEDEC